MEKDKSDILYIGGGADADCLRLHRQPAGDPGDGSQDSDSQPHATDPDGDCRSGGCEKEADL